MTEQPSTRDVLIYLAGHVDWLAHRPEAPDAFDELTTACRHVRNAVDTAPDLIFLGTCEKCSEDMYARPGALTVECRNCGRRYDVKERRAWLLEQIDDRLERAADLCRALHGFGIDITRHRLKQWEIAGRLAVKGHDAKGNPLYRVGDVVRVANAMLHK